MDISCQENISIKIIINTRNHDCFSILSGCVVQEIRINRMNLKKDIMLILLQEAGRCFIRLKKMGEQSMVESKYNYINKKWKE
jgi:hypothetical protein